MEGKGEKCGKKVKEMGEKIGRNGENGTHLSELGEPRWWLSG
jgi:hypothetical protein